LESVDPARIGVIGFSLGGFLVLRSITQQPELFAAAIDFYGLSDLKRYYHDNPSTRAALSQLLGGTLEQNPEAYRAASPINFVDRIKTPLLSSSWHFRSFGAVQLFCRVGESPQAGPQKL